MRRLILIAGMVATLFGGAGLAAGASAYECAQFTNPTVNSAWQTVCNLPQSPKAHP